MAEPPDQMQAAAGSGCLRASNADREQAIGTLKAAFVQGMLAKEEFDLRVGQAFAARTYAELAVITGDLPAGLTTATPPVRAHAQVEGEPRIRRPGRMLAVATVLYFAVWAVAFRPDQDGGAGAVLAATFCYVTVWLVAATPILADWLNKHL